ncbi:MAG: AI-2E family transporter, partial [Rikenellaceae bacterium]
MGKLERYIIGGFIAAIIVFLIWFFSNVVTYILVAAIISLMGKPLVDLLCRLKFKSIYIPKWAASTLVIGAMWGIAIILVSIFVPIIYSRVQAFAVTGIENFAQYANKPLQDISNFLYQRFNYTMTLSSDAIVSEVYARLNTIVSSSVSSVASVIDFITSAFVALFSVTFIAFFFMKENQLFDDGVVMLFPQKYEKNVREAIGSSINLISKYLLGLAGESTIKTIVITIGLYFIGLDFGTAFMIGIITGVLNVIP